MTQPVPHRNPVDLPRLRAVIDPISSAHGADVVAVELRNESGWVLRVYVEKVGTEGADLDLCAAISRDLSPALDVADLIPHHYVLEVSSPGLERPLTGEGDFRRFEGRLARVKLRHESASAQKVFTGQLGPVTGEELAVLEGTRVHKIRLADIDKARLVFEMTKARKK